MLIAAVIPLIVTFVTIAAGAEGPDFSFGDADFSVEYLKAAFNSTTNSVVSPLSIRLALTAFYQVAGPSVEQTMQRAFYLPLEKSVASEHAASFLEEINANKQLRLAFKVLKHQDALSEDFISTLGKVFKVAPEDVYFTDKPAIVQNVNTWASDKTQGQIQNFLSEDDIDVNTELIMLNAISLRASWAEKFSVDKTTREPFAFKNGPQMVDMMHESLEVLYTGGKSYHAVQIPYSEDSDLSMWIIIPRGTGSFESLMESLSAELLEEIETNATPKGVDVSLPRFQIRTNQDARSVIEEMGYKQLFSGKDFNVFKDKKSGISDLKQNTYLLVDEEGTQAAAVSSTTTKFRTKNIQFNVNQPFVFIVKKISSDTIVFIGHHSVYQ